MKKLMTILVAALALALVAFTPDLASAGHGHGGGHGYFRGPDVTLGGMIQKPTGGRDTTVSLLGQYQLAPAWRNADERLMQGARYLMVEVTA